MAQTNLFSFFAGESIALDFIEADYSVTPAVPRNIAGWTIKLSIEGGPTKAATITSSANGQYSFVLSAAETGAMTPTAWPPPQGSLGKYHYSVKRIDSGATAVLATGTITVLPVIGAFA